MKFVCENCKAKYQISDDKVAGRTLRMKCRRCGEMIQVAATVTESSVSQKLPVEQATGSAPSPIRATPPPRPAVDAAGLQAAGPAGDESNSADDGATVIRRSPFFQPEPANRPAPAPGMAPRPPGPRIVPPARASLSGAKSSRPPPRPSNPGPIPGVGMHAPSSPGLHAGFARAVATVPPPSQVAGGALPTEDWYVGIGGVPLGPVRLTVLRDKATAGQVDGDSLVWREGFDEWQAIKSIQPLMALVDEAKQTRASRVSLPAVVAPTPRPSIASVAIAAAPAPLASSPGMAVLPAPAPSLPFDLVRSGTSPAPGGMAPLAATSSAGPASDPFASALPPPSPRPSIPGAAPSVNGAGVNGGANGYGLTTTAGLASSMGPSIGGAPSSASPSVIPAPPAELSPQSLPASKKRGGLPPAAWALIAMAAAFGGVAAWALFLRPKEPAQSAPVAAQQQEQKTGDAQLGASPPPPPAPTATGEVPAPGASVAMGPGGAGYPRGPGGAVPSGTAKSPDGSPIDKTGFQPTPGGPSASDPPPSGGGALTEGEINGVVSRNKPMITRRCWLPAYDARSSGAPTTAKVSVSLKVAPSGSVSSVSAGGSETHYPGLASCVAGSVKGWTFPPSDEGATINIPFSFSGQ